jgi:hypothetical protein
LTANGSQALVEASFEAGNLVVFREEVVAWSVNVSADADATTARFSSICA